MTSSSAAIRSFCVNYCDDIRLEVGNKISLIGIYGADLLVPEMPAVIPKLCIYVQIYSELEAHFDDDIEVKVLIDDDVINSSRCSPKDGAVLGAKQFHKLALQFVISPFVIDKECVLRTRASYKGVEYVASGLNIRRASSAATLSAT